MINNNVETNDLSFQWVEHRRETISNFQINDQQLKMITFFRILGGHNEFTTKLLTINGNY